VAIVRFHLLMTCSDLRTKAFGKTATKKQVGKPVTRDGKAVKFPLEPESGREDMDGRITDGI